MIRGTAITLLLSVLSVGFSLDYALMLETQRPLVGALDSYLPVAERQVIHVDGVGWMYVADVFGGEPGEELVNGVLDLLSRLQTTVRGLDDGDALVVLLIYRERLSGDPQGQAEITLSAAGEGSLAVKQR